MSGYMFRQRCRPRGDFRIPQIMEFLDVMKEAFRYSRLYDSHDKPVELTETGLRKILEKNVDKVFPSIGATLDFFTIPPRKMDDDTVSFEIHTGTQPDEPFIDAYDISMDDKRKIPDFDYLERSIQIFKPFEAFLSETENEYQLNAFNRQRAHPGFSKPAIIRGFHYLDEGMARSIGGSTYCLKAPAWHVKKFCDGVLFELFPGPLDSDNPDHLEAQEGVVAYFNML